MYIWRSIMNRQSSGLLPFYLTHKMQFNDHEWGWMFTSYITYYRCIHKTLSSHYHNYAGQVFSFLLLNTEYYFMAYFNMWHLFWYKHISIVIWDSMINNSLIDAIVYLSHPIYLASAWIPYHIILKWGSEVLHFIYIDLYDGFIKKKSDS